MEICDVMSSNASMGSKESEANYKHVHVRSATWAVPQPWIYSRNDDLKSWHLTQRQWERTILAWRNTQQTKAIHLREQGHSQGEWKIVPNSHSGSLRTTLTHLANVERAAVPKSGEVVKARVKSLTGAQRSQQRKLIAILGICEYGGCKQHTCR